MDKIQGSIEVTNSLQLTAEMEMLDEASKELLKNREVLAVILQGTITEYRGYSLEEIMNFIETDSIETKEVSNGRTNSRIQGENIEFQVINELTTKFDIYFTAINPKHSTKKVIVKLHIDLEPQKNYRPGYPIEKRGMYYLARSLSSQIPVATKKVNYNNLEKCYSIWICRDRIPQREQNTVSFYKMQNYLNYGTVQPNEKNFDLFELVIIRLGKEMYNIDEQEEQYRLLKFLNTVFYPRQEKFMDVISEYIDFSQNEKLKEEVCRVGGLGESVYAEGLEQGIEQGIDQGIRIFIKDKLEDDIPKERIVEKLMKNYNLEEQKALAYIQECEEEVE